MKSLVLSIMFVATAMISNKVAAQIENGAKIDFSKEVHDYGNIKNGANGTCTFEFTNTGNATRNLSTSIFAIISSIIVIYHEQHENFRKRTIFNYKPKLQQGSIS